MAQIRPSREKKSIPISHICALLHFLLNSAKPVRNRFVFTHVFKKHYFSSKFDVFEMVHVGPSREKNPYQLHSFVRFCTPFQTVQTQ